jgi:predicted MFS family arabinose efflux permease
LKPSSLARITLFALFWANFLNFFDRQVIAALAPLLKDFWQLSDYQVGLLGTAFEVTYALAPVPVAMLADRWLRSRVVALALAVWSGAMILTGAAASYAMLLASRALLGIGEASYGPSALAWLGDLFSPARRSRAVAVHDVALMLGSAGGYALGGVLGVTLGWRPVFFLAALPGFLLAAVIWFLPEPPKGQSDLRALGYDRATAPDRAPPLRQTLGELAATPTLWVIYGVAILINLASVGMIFWMPSFVGRAYGLNESQAGLLVGSVTVVAGAAGVLSGGFVADRLLRYTAAARLFTVSISYLLGLPFALFAIQAPSLPLFVLWAALTVYLFTFYFPCLAPLVHQVTRPRLRATAMALGLFIVHILGNAPAPAMVGWLSDRTGSLRSGLGGVLFLALLAGLVGLWGTRFVQRDTERMWHRLEKETRPHAGESC